MNRFHVVLGLLELGEVERAKNFILHLQNDDRENGERVIRRFKDPVIAGLLTGQAELLPGAREWNWSFRKTAGFLSSLRQSRSTRW